ncbi:hypothetical protein Hanom_Chr15g01383701 [Helianthus anomalus]
MHVTHSLLSIIFLYKVIYILISLFKFTLSCSLCSLLLYFQTTFLMYLSSKSLILYTQHLFIKDKRKRKLSLTRFQNKFWGYVVCLDDGNVIHMIMFVLVFAFY